MNSSRRKFLESALGVPVAACLGRSSVLCFGSGRHPGALEILLPPVGQMEFENPQLIRYDASCFTINNQDAFIMSGAFHYPRCPRALWRDRLARFKAAGFNTIETYAFWNYHEPEEGRADLTEFEDFVKLVKEMGFWMIARPGPYVCAEWDAGGFPHWIVAKRFPLRSDDPQSIATSQHWYSLVLPIIQRHQVTLGGPIIMMQIENEYDYWDLPAPQKLAYVRSLAETAWNSGINVPLITCWTKPARQNSDPDMARVMDACNFYPRWNVVKEVVPQLQKLRQEEPTSPVGVTELQGGWFSEFGGKLSVDQDGVNGAQLNLVTKTTIEQGATYFSYYMGFGGTNFDWAAKNLTTTYDYAAPIREPGGLWEKYYAARGIGASLHLFGSVLTRAQLPQGSNQVVVQSSNPDVSVTVRWNSGSGVVFVRENASAEQRYKMTFPDPGSPTHRIISVPREGELVIGPREMKMLPVQIPIPGSQLKYSTAEVAAAGSLTEWQYLVVYDEPGRLAEISLTTRAEPQIEGETEYRYWDQEYEAVVFGVRVESEQKILLINNHLLLVVLPRELALKCWTAEFPVKSMPQILTWEEQDRAERQKAGPPERMRALFLGDIAMLAESGVTKNLNWVDLDFRPGEHDLTVLLPPTPTKCIVDGVPTDFHYERPRRSTRLHVTTPSVPTPSLTLNDVESWVERFDPNAGKWISGAPRALENLGSLPYGYVKYRAQFAYSGQPKMIVATFDEDAKRVFVNGTLVVLAANNSRQVEFPLTGLAKTGDNTIEISYELFGSDNGGHAMGNLKGIESVRYGADAQSAAVIEAWQIQRFPGAISGAATPGHGPSDSIDPDYSQGGWTRGSLSASAFGASEELAPAFTWVRAGFGLAPPAAGWWIPWKLTFEADRDALLYLNGKFVGRYVTVGPQKDFYLPEPYLVFDGKLGNTLTVVLAYADGLGHIKTFKVGPYEEFATRRTHVEFQW
jgi:Glycosyl hydrolases family 35/Beta-galactosidase, domain 2/Beta-galactosidase second all-beta domain